MHSKMNPWVLHGRVCSSVVLRCNPSLLIVQQSHRTFDGVGWDAVSYRRSFRLVMRVWLMLVLLVLRAVIETVAGTARWFFRVIFSFFVPRATVLYCIVLAMQLLSVVRTV